MSRSCSLVCFLWIFAQSLCLAADSPVSREAIDRRIEQYRTAEVTLYVTDAAGQPMPGAEVTIEMVRHKFLFGCNAFLLGQYGKDAWNDGYGKRFAALFNYATLPFYWNAYEPRPGQTEEQRVRKMAEWCRDNGIRAKGHPLCWHQVVPAWVAGKPLDEIRRLQLARIEREMKAFAGLIDVWDVVNEVMIAPRLDRDNPITRLCNERGPLELVRATFGTARRVSPNAMLILNDFDSSAACAEQTGQFIKAGIPIDAIGMQSHFHRGCPRSEEAWAALQRFAKIGKPLHITETTILSGHLKTDDDWNREQSNWNSTAEGEQLQAEQVAELYRLAFSHPAVEALTWWDFSDQGAWMGAPAGLLHKDMSPKPAYDALMKLIKGRWWTGPLKLKTDAAGKVSFRGYLGRYKIETGAGCMAVDVVRCGAESLTVRIATTQR